MSILVAFAYLIPNTDVIINKDKKRVSSRLYSCENWAKEMKQRKSVIPCHEISVIPRQGKIMTMYFLMAIHLECTAGNGKFFKLLLWGVKKRDSILYLLFGKG